MQQPELLTDPRFEKYQDRRMNWGLLVDELEEWSKKMSVKDVVAALEKQGDHAGAECHRNREVLVGHVARGLGQQGKRDSGKQHLHAPPDSIPARRASRIASSKKNS